MPGRELHVVRNGLLRIGDVAAKIAALHVDIDVDREFAVLGADRVRPAGLLHLGDLAKGHRAAAGSGTSTSRAMASGLSRKSRG